MFAWKTRKNEKLYSPARKILAFAVCLIGGAFAGIWSMYFATGKYSLEMLELYFQNPYIVLLNILPPIVISAVFYLLFNRAVVSFVLTNAVIILPTLVNYYKMEFRGDGFIFEDLTLIGESKNMLEIYKLFIDDRISHYIVTFAVATLLCAFLARGRFYKKRFRMLAALVLAAGLFAMTPIYSSEKFYNEKTANHSLINPYSDSAQYASKGFVYPFLHSVKSAFHPAPDGYSEKAALAELGKYTDAEILADKRVNIVGVMLEAFNDFSRLDCLTFTEDIYGKYHELEKMGYSGTLVTDIFAGDTRVSEREFLTGLPYKRLDSFVASSNSYVWYLRENGYVTTGSHPCYAWFYNRQNINKNLGFESYLFSENHYKALTGGDITYDARFFPELYSLYVKRDLEKPYFSFNVSYQGHGPYEADNAYFDSTFVENKGYSKKDETMLNNYLHSQKGTVGYLYDFVNDMLATDEPLVLVIFGDHKPWLGNNQSVYDAIGLNIDVSTEDGFLNYYSTRYLILANDAAKKLCGNDFAGEGETISVSLLMNKVFELCGYRGPAYMQYTSELMKNTPVIHRTDDLSDEKFGLYDSVTYYYRRNFLY